MARDLIAEMNQPKGRDLIAESQAQQAGFDIGQRADEFVSGVNRGGFGLLDLPFNVANAMGDLLARGVGVVSPKAEEFLRSPSPLPATPFSNLASRMGGFVEPQDRTGRIIEKVGEFVGASAFPVGAVAGSARSGVQSANPLINSLLQDAGKSVPKFLEKELAAATAAGSGAGIASEAFPGNPVAEIAGALAPAGILAATKGLARGAFRGGEQGRQTVQQNIDTFADAGTTPSVGQATGGTGIQGLETVVGKSPGGMTAMRNAAEKTSREIGLKIDDLASGISKKSGAEVAGRVIEKGIVNGFASRFRNQSQKLYEKLNKFIPDNTKVAINQTTKTLDDLAAPIAGAESVSGVLANPKILQIQKALAEDAAQTGTLPYSAVKQLRSTVGRLLSSSEIVSEAPRAQLKQLYGALSQDMRVAAEAAGPKAMKAFNRANKFWASGTNRIDDVLEKVTKRANPEDVFRAATAGKEGGTTVRAVMRSLNPEEQAVVSATVLRRMGKARNSSQDALGEVFSVETFLTNWNALSKEAKTALFARPNLGTLSKDLNQVAKAASSIREGSRVLANPSGTAGQGASMVAGGSAVTSVLAGMPSIAAGIGALMTLNRGAAALLTNPEFVKWLAQSTRIAPARMPGHIARLSVIAKDFDDEGKEAVQEYLQALQ